MPIYLAKYRDCEVSGELIGRNDSQGKEKLANEVIRRARILNRPDDFTPVEIDFYPIIVVNGMLERDKPFQYSIIPPQRERNEEEFERKQAQILENLPKAFHSFVSSYAWDQGHAHGYNEVLIHLETLVDGLVPAIKEYDTTK